MILSHFKFAQRFYLNIVYCDQFYESIEKTRQAFIFLKQPSKEEILRFKDSLNRGLSETSFKYLDLKKKKKNLFEGHLSKHGEEPGTELV